MSDKKFHFEYHVTGLSEAACDELNQIVVNFVQEAGGTIGGGFAAEEER